MARTKGSSTAPKRTLSPSETSLEAALADFKKRCVPKVSDEDQKSCATDLVAQIEALVADEREPLTALQELITTCSSSSSLRHILFHHPVTTCALISALFAHLWVVIYASCFPRLNFETQWLADKVEEGSACDKLIFALFDTFVAWMQDCNEQGSSEKLKKARIDFGTNLFPVLAKMLLEGIDKLTPVCRRELCAAVGEGISRCPEMKALWLDEKTFGLRGLALILDHCEDDIDLAMGGIEMLYRLAPSKGDKMNKDEYYKALVAKSGLSSAMGKRLVKMMIDIAPTELAATTDALIKVLIGTGSEKAQIIHVHNLAINNEELSNRAQSHLAIPGAKYNAPLHINSKNMSVAITVPVRLGGVEVEPEEDVAEWSLKAIADVKIVGSTDIRSKINIKLKSPVTIRGADFPKSSIPSLVDLEIDTSDVNKFIAAMKAREVRCITYHQKQELTCSDDNFESHPKASGTPAIQPYVPTPARVYTRPEREQLMAQQAASRSNTSASGSSAQSNASNASAALLTKPSRAPVTMPPPPEVPTFRHVSPIQEEPVKNVKPTPTKAKSAKAAQVSASKPRSSVKKASKSNANDTQDSDLPPLTDSGDESDLPSLEEESAPLTEKSASKAAPAPKKVATKSAAHDQEPVEPPRRTSAKRKERPETDEEPMEAEEEPVVLPKSLPTAKKAKETYKRKKADSPKGVTAMKGRDGKTAAQKNTQKSLAEDEADGNATDYDAAPVAARPPPAAKKSAAATKPKPVPKAAAKPKAAADKGPQPTKILPARRTRTSRTVKEVEEEEDEDQEEVLESIKNSAPPRMPGKPISRPSAAALTDKSVKPTSKPKSTSGSRVDRVSRLAAAEVNSDPTEPNVQEEVPYSDEEFQPDGKAQTMSQLVDRVDQEEAVQLPEMEQQVYEPEQESADRAESRTPPRQSARKEASAAPDSAVEDLARLLMDHVRGASATPSRSDKRVFASKSPHHASREQSVEATMEQAEVGRKHVSAPAKQTVNNNDTPLRSAPRSAPPSILKSALKRSAPSPVVLLPADPEQEGDSDDDEASNEAMENIVRQLADRLKSQKNKNVSQTGDAIINQLLRQAAAAGNSMDIDEDMSPQKEASSDHLFRQRFEMPNSVDNLLPESDPPQPTMLRVPAPNDLPFRAQRPPMSASRLNEQANQQRFVPMARPTSARPPAPVVSRAQTQAKAQPSPAKKRRVDTCPGVDRLAKGAEMLESAQKISHFIIGNIANNVDQTRYQSREAKLGLVNMVQEQLEIYEEQNRYMVSGTIERLDLQNRDELELLQVMDEQVNGLQLLMKHCKNHHKRMEEQKKNMPDVDAMWASLANFP